MISALILTMVSLTQQDKGLPDDIEYWMYAWRGDVAANTHVTVLAEHFGLEGLYTTEYHAFVRKGQVDADKLWSYVESTGLPIVQYGGPQRSARDEPKKEKYKRNGPVCAISGRRTG